MVIKRLIEEFVKFLNSKEMLLVHECQSSLPEDWWALNWRQIDEYIEQFLQTQTTVKLIELNPDKRYVAVAPHMSPEELDEFRLRFRQWGYSKEPFLVTNGVEIVCLGRKDE